MNNRPIQKSLLRAAALGLFLCGSGAFPENGWAVGRTTNGAATYADKFKNSRVGQYAQKKTQQVKTKAKDFSRDIQKRRVDDYNRRIESIKKKLEKNNLTDLQRSKLMDDQKNLLAKRGELEKKIAAGGSSRKPSDPKSDAGRSPGKSSDLKSDAPPSYDQAVGNQPPYTEKPRPGE